MAFSAGTFTLQEAGQKDVRELPKGFMDGNEYVIFKMVSTTSLESMGLFAVKKSKITSEGANPATFTVA